MISRELRDEKERLIAEHQRLAMASVAGLLDAVGAKRLESVRLRLDEIRAVEHRANLREDRGHSSRRIGSGAGMSLHAGQTVSRRPGRSEP